MTLYLAIIDSNDQPQYTAFDTKEDAVDHLNSYIANNIEYYDTDEYYDLTYKDWDDVTDFAEQLSIQKIKYVTS